MQSFFSKRSLKQNPLKRTKSVSKLERGRRGEVPPPPRLRGSRSHESLLQSPGGPWGLEGARLGPLHPSLRNHPAQGQAWVRKEERNNAITGYAVEGSE